MAQLEAGQEIPPGLVKAILESPIYGAIPITDLGGTGYDPKAPVPTRRCEWVVFRHEDEGPWLRPRRT